MNPAVIAKSARNLLSAVEIKVNRRLGREFVPAPRDMLFIETSSLCNLKCRFCAYEKKHSPKISMKDDFFVDCVGQALDLVIAVRLTPCTAMSSWIGISSGSWVREIIQGFWVINFSQISIRSMRTSSLVAPESSSTWPSASTVTTATASSPSRNRTGKSRSADLNLDLLFRISAGDLRRNSASAPRARRPVPPSEIMQRWPVSSARHPGAALARLQQLGRHDQQRGREGLGINITGTDAMYRTAPARYCSRPCRSWRPTVSSTAAAAATSMPPCGSAT